MLGTAKIVNPASSFPSLFLPDNHRRHCADWAAVAISFYFSSCSGGGGCGHSPGPWSKYKKGPFSKLARVWPAA
jgi:hypothetical protein